MTSREFQTGPDPAKAKYRQERSEHWDAYSTSPERWVGWWGRYYHKQLARVYRSLVAPGQRVLELGCAHGDLLAVLEPAMGVGVDFSQEMIRAAATRHPRLRFIHADAHDLPLDEKFDVIILAELVNDLWDVETVLREVARLSTPRTRIILSFYNRLWQLPVGLGQRLAVEQPAGRALGQAFGDGRLSRHWRHYFSSLGLPWRLWSRRLARTDGRGRPSASPWTAWWWRAKAPWTNPCSPGNRRPCVNSRPMPRWP